MHQARTETQATLNPFERDLLYRLTDGVDPAMKVFHYVYLHMPRWGQMAQWLIKNKITGMTLVYFWLHEHQRSYDSMAKFILGRIDGEKKPAILFGIDWKPIQ
jgi:hypothetical protein